MVGGGQTLEMLPLVVVVVETWFLMVVMVMGMMICTQMILDPG